MMDKQLILNTLEKIREDIENDKLVSAYIKTQLITEHIKEKD